MKSLQQYVEELNRLMTALITVAEKMRDMSLQVISEEDLSPLQKEQERLLSLIEGVDRNIQEEFRQQLDAKTQLHFHNQLQTFQKLNQEFIQNLNMRHGIIQFELQRVNEEEQDFSHLSILKKVSLPPNSSEAVEPEESEKGG